MKTKLHNEKGLSIKIFNIVLVCLTVLIITGLIFSVIRIKQVLESDDIWEMQVHLINNIKNLCILVVLSVFIILSIIWSSVTFLLNPLMKSVEKIRQNKRLERTATQEFNFLIRNYNEVFDENKKLMEVLKHEAISANEKFQKIQEEKRKNDVISGLASIYNAVYLVDFNEDKMIPYNIGNQISQRLNTSDFEGDSYNEKMEVFITKFVAPEYKGQISFESTPEQIKKQLEKSSYYTINFDRFDMNGKIENIDMCISSISENKDFSRIVMAFKKGQN